MALPPSVGLVMLIGAPVLASALPARRTSEAARLSRSSDTRAAILTDVGRGDCAIAPSRPSRQRAPLLRACTPIPPLAAVPVEDGLHDSVSNPYRRPASRQPPTPSTPSWF